MNDERIAKILEWLADRVAKAEGFVIEQAPDVVQQIITMDVVTSYIYMVALTLPASLLIALIVMLWRASAKWDVEEKVSVRIMGCGLMSAAVIGLLVGVMLNGVVIAKAHYAPKAYLLERAGVLKK